MSKYDDNFYKNRFEMTKHASERILGIVKDCYNGQICSAIDMGCGVGAWLATIRKLYGDVAVHGVDGAYVNKDYLVISPQEFEEWDLEKRYFGEHGEKYDIAISLEVAEHLSQKRAYSFVEDLTSMSDLVLFSAAIPYQKILGGAVHHVNEQRLSYWVKIFDSLGFELHDIIRPEIWNDDSIPVYYMQNCVLFVRRESEVEKSLSRKNYTPIVDMVHPIAFETIGKMLGGRLGRAYQRIEHILIKIRERL